MQQLTIIIIALLLHLKCSISSGHHLSVKGACSNSSCKQIRTRLRIDAPSVIVIYKTVVFTLNGFISLILYIHVYQVFICQKKVINYLVSHLFAISFHCLAKICIKPNQCNLSFILKLALNFNCKMPVYKYMRFRGFFSLPFPCQGVPHWRAKSSMSRTPHASPTREDKQTWQLVINKGANIFHKNGT